MDKSTRDTAYDCTAAMIESQILHMAQKHDMMPEMSAEIIMSALLSFLIRQTDDIDAASRFLIEAMEGKRIALHNGPNAPAALSIAEAVGKRGAELARLRIERISALEEANEEIDGSATHNATSTA